MNYVPDSNPHYFSLNFCDIHKTLHTNKRSRTSSNGGSKATLEK
ncbi:hypothetical protein ALT1644_440034 [Alteromonas macleodii]